MVSYLDLLNEARGRQRSKPITTTAIAGNGGDALQGVQAVNQANALIRRSSVDFDYSEPIKRVTLTIGNPIVPTPSGLEAWNPQLIHEVKYVDSTTNRLLDVPIKDAIKAKEIEIALTENGEPLFYYVNQGVVKVIPTPDQAYTLEVTYQTVIQTITSSNITSDVTFPADFYEVFVDFVYAYLRRGQADPEWSSLEEKAKNELSKIIIRNKFNLKNNGKRLFRMRRSRDRNL